MNQQPKNQITDQQLDDMLRAIQVPADLKARLLEIPTTEQQDQIQQDPQLVIPSTTVPLDRQTSTRWLPYVTVATLLIIAGIVATQPFGKTTTSNQDTIAKHTSSDDKQTAHDNLIAAKHKPALLEETAQRLASIENIIRLSQAPARSYLSTEDISSMIMALAPEYSLELGGSQADLESEMSLVREKFPQSRGADIAQQILQRLN